MACCNATLQVFAKHHWALPVLRRQSHSSATLECLRSLVGSREWQCQVIQSHPATLDPEHQVDTLGDPCDASTGCQSKTPRTFKKPAICDTVYKTSVDSILLQQWGDLQPLQLHPSSSRPKVMGGDPHPEKLARENDILPRFAPKCSSSAPSANLQCKQVPSAYWTLPRIRVGKKEKLQLPWAGVHCAYPLKLCSSGRVSHILTSSASRLLNLHPRSSA